MAKPGPLRGIRDQYLTGTPVRSIGRKGLVGEILARAAGSPHEVCGLLLGSDEQVADVLHCSNVAAAPEREFEIAPAQLIAALRAARSGAAEVVGCYHSHPGGVPEPSARDAADAAPSGWLWLIVGGDEAKLWRAVPAGARHGRFDPVPFAS